MREAGQDPPYADDFTAPVRGGDSTADVGSPIVTLPRRAPAPPQ